MAVVVDSSVLIDQLRIGPVEALRRLLGDALIILPPLVVAELLSGAHTAAARAFVGDLLKDATVPETSLAHWISVGDLRRNLQRRGVNVTLPDAHVAQCALDLDAELLTRDKIFRLIADQVPLRLA